MERVGLKRHLRVGGGKFMAAVVECGKPECLLSLTIALKRAS